MDLVIILLVWRIFPILLLVLPRTSNSINFKCGCWRFEVGMLLLFFKKFSQYLSLSVTIYILGQ